MIITRTPLRVSFLGGGTDYPEYFRQHGGATLAMAIDKFVYITIAPLGNFFNHRIRLSYSQLELCRTVQEIQHSSVRECMKAMEIDGGVDISVVSDLPARTGLGSSSCFTVCLLHALHALKGELVSREQLAAEAVHIERECIGERVGLQDQYSCAMGGLALYRFSGERRVTIDPLPLSEARRHELLARLLLFYTGQQRSTQEIIEAQMSRTVSGIIQPTLDRLRHLVDSGVSVLTGSSDLREFGELLHEGWMLKKELSHKVSNSLIDEVYARGRSAGAIGGKLLGAGNGGFVLLFAEPDDHAAIRATLSDFKEVRFSSDSDGSRIIYYRP